jgi:hypothetical protein
MYKLPLHKISKLQSTVVTGKPAGIVVYRPRLLFRPMCLTPKRRTKTGWIIDWPTQNATDGDGLGFHQGEADVTVRVNVTLPCIEGMDHSAAAACLAESGRSWRLESGSAKTYRRWYIATQDGPVLGKVF